MVGILERRVPDAMTASPMNLSIVPPRAWIASPMAVRTRLTSSVSRSGESRSVMAVKSRTSTNITVASRSSPPRRNAEGSATKRSTIALER